MARQFIVYDTETTGRKKAEIDITLPSAMRQRGDEVCQIGGIILNDKMEPIKLFCHYCDTVAVEVSAGAFAVNEISMQEVRKYVRCQYLSNVLLDKVPEFFWDDTIFIGYNIEFDQEMVKQTLANTDVPFDWQPFKGSIVPKKGRWAVDVAEYFKQPGNPVSGKNSYYRKLSSFSKELEGAREAFLSQFGHLEVDTNCLELLAPSWERSHNAFFDALNTYLLWRDRIWRKKLV